MWVDDVVLISDNAKELQEMLDITYNVASKYRNEFGQAKSQTMCIKSNPRKKVETVNFKLGKMELQNATKYKYLGKIQSNGPKCST